MTTQMISGADRKHESTPSIEGCPFCNLPLNFESEFDIHFPIDDERDVLLKPDQVMLIPGHFLTITRSHLTSFAQIAPDRLGSINERLNFYEATLYQQFGSYFRLEHGSDNISGSGSGACIEHAHTHLIPADEDAGAYIQDQLPWQQLDRYEDLSEFKGAPYIYLGRLATHYVVPDPRLPGQWVRRQVAAVRRLEQWDWALMDSKKELKLTLEGIKAIGIDNLYPREET